MSARATLPGIGFLLLGAFAAHLLAPIVGIDRILLAIAIGALYFLINDRAVPYVAPTLRDLGIGPVADPAQPVAGDVVRVPALGLAAEPATVPDIGPEFVEVAAQAVGLDAQLAGQPAQRLDAAQR